MAKKRKRK
jgi:Family of unknown function (DUF6496)